jgi:hypothetical protein
MQNAADSGALAGARELCFGWPAQAEAAAEDYARRNGGVNITVTIVDNLVTVVSRIDADTYFAGIIGIDTVDIGAEAQAACGAANSACGLWPIGFDIVRYGELLWAQCYMNPTEDVSFYVWAGDNPNQQPICGDVPGIPAEHDCDVNGDGINDIVSMLHRAWLDFSDVVVEEFPDDCVQPGCGANELVCWIRDRTGAKVHIPACIAGNTGVKAGTQAAVNSRIGSVVGIPLFDHWGCVADLSCPGNSINAVGFGCIRVGGWKTNLELPRIDGELPPWKGPVIRAVVDCNSECHTQCGGTFGDPVGPGGMKAVSLLR